MIDIMIVVQGQFQRPLFKSMRYVMLCLSEANGKLLWLRQLYRFPTMKLFGYVN